MWVKEEFFFFIIMTCIKSRVFIMDNIYIYKIFDNLKLFFNIVIEKNQVMLMQYKFISKKFKPFWFVYVSAYVHIFQFVLLLRYYKRRVKHKFLH